MTNFKHIYVWIALMAMAYWCSPIHAQERVIRLNDVLHMPDSAGTGGDSVMNPSAVNQINQLQVKVYPNPATNYFELAVPGDDREYFLLIALDGRVIREFLNGGPIDISMLPRGSYFVMLKNEPGRMKPVRLTVI